MENFLSGGINELEQAKAAIIKANRLEEDLLESERLLKANDKDIEAQRKAMNDKIESSVTSRREELEKFHDEQITESKKSIKAIEKERKAARAKAVNSRISGETGAFADQNKKLNSQIRAMFRQAKIPTFCNSAAYYSLFHPKTVKDFIILAVCVLLAVAVIPNVVCLLIKTTTFLRILIYVAIVLVFAALYFGIFVATKGNGKGSVIDKAYSLRKRVKNNRKQIRLTSDSIRTDQDESGYGLEQFDEDIRQAQNVLQSKEDAKAAALADFDSVTAPAIRQEIENECLPAIQQLEADSKALKADFMQKRSASTEAATNINNTYAAYLGAKNATPERIDEMINLLGEGQAQTIMQALNIVNGETR